MRKPSQRPWESRSPHVTASPFAPQSKEKHQKGRHRCRSRNENIKTDPQPDPLRCRKPLVRLRLQAFHGVGRCVGQAVPQVPIFPQNAKKRHDFMQNRVSFGAATQIRTGDLILTNYLYGVNSSLLLVIAFDMKRL